MNYRLYLLLIAIPIAMFMAFAARRKYKLPGATSLLVMSISLIAWSLSTLIYENSSDPYFEKLWVAILFLSMLFTASAQLTFSLSYTNHADWLNRSALIMLGILP